MRRSIGEMRFVGTLLAGEDETSEKITSARIEFEGLVFTFSEDRPLVVQTENEGDRTLIPREYFIEDETLVITFSDESTVRFEVSLSPPSELHLIPTGTDEWPRDARVIIPWSTTPAVAFRPPSESTPEILDLTVEDRVFFLSVPPRAVVDHAAGTLEIPPTASSRLIRYVERVDTEINVIETAFSRNQHRITDDFYRDTVRHYIDIGFQGWATTRFNGGSGTWDMREGSARFSEEILTAYLAEAWRRDQYTTAFNQMRRAADQHSDQVGFLSAPFLGNLREVTRTFIEQDQQRALTLATRIAGRDPTVFRERDLLPFAAFRGNETLFRDLIQFMRSVDYREIEITTAIGMLRTTVSTNHPSEQSREAARRFESVIEERIYPAIRQFEDLFFVETGQGEIDLQYSIEAGILLERYGRRLGDMLPVTVGRNLVLSGLQLADNRGFLPRLIFFNTQGMERQEGSFGPEALYPLIAENPRYPRMISLYDELGAGSFIWTIVDFPRVEIGTQQYSFRLQYPPNRTHYIIMQGIPPFESMILFNLQWRNDPTFELYIKGRHYDPATNTLMIKYTDNSSVGDIILFY